jgi:thymidylate synthase (FAD)
VQIVKPDAYIITHTPNILAVIEGAARNCYQTAPREEGREAFLRRVVLELRHESVLEHASVTVKVICDRGTSHALVRHRHTAYSQESSRYCNYSKGRFDHVVRMIEPLPQGHPAYPVWLEGMNQLEKVYFEMLRLGATTDQARGALPTCAKTALVMTANIREWRHIFRLRTSPEAHEQVQAIMGLLLSHFAERWPVLFEDIVLERAKEVGDVGAA